MLQNQDSLQCLLFMLTMSDLPENRSSLISNDMGLSARQLEVLSHLARGRAAKEIGVRLGISQRTVEHHIENIKNKTNCKSKADLINMYWDLNG